MRNSRLLLILSGLVLLAVILLLNLPHKSLNPPVSIRIAAVTNENTVVLFRELNPRLFTFLEEVRVEETNYSAIPIEVIKVAFDLKTKKYLFRFDPPLKSDKAYRMIASYSHRGALEQKLYSWVSPVHVLHRFFPTPRQGSVTSEWFVVKTEVSISQDTH